MLLSAQSSGDSGTAAGEAASPWIHTHWSRLFRLTLHIAVICAVTACTGLPPGFLAAPEAPAHWGDPTTGLLTSSPPQPWLDDFDGPFLKELVETAMAYNYDLQGAAARIDSARAQARIATAATLPGAEALFEASRARTGSGSRNRVDAYEVGGTLSWEADIWGRLANAERAASLEAGAVEADFRAARLLLAATVARTWFGAIEAEQQVQLALRTLDSFRKSLTVIEQRYRLGLNSALDVRLARTDVAAAESAVAARLRDRDAILRELEVLTGAYPAARLKAASSLPHVRAEVPGGLPSDLLARRPDLVAAELRLASAGERLDEARKNRLPSIRLTASGGTASDTLTELLDWDRLVWRLLGGLTQPLYQGGRLKAEEALARARHREAWAAYAQTVLVAFREVETSLSAESRYLEQERALKRATEEAQAAEELAAQRYRQGLVDIITLLESRRRAFNAESTQLRTARERLDNRVALYLALGGDFESADPASAGASR